MTEPTTTPATLLRTALFSFHVAHGAHLVPFAGWEMPLYYDSILAEHQAVRQHVGLFDVSHMGVLTVAGGHSADLLGRRTTANVGKLLPGQVRYTFLLDAGAEIVDDLLISRIDDGTHPDPSFLVVPNAAHASEVYDLLRSHRRPDTTVQHLNPNVAILAVQGSAARGLLETLFGWRLGGLKYYTSRRFPAERTDGPAADGVLGTTLPADLAHHFLVSRTGYTGEAGYEIFVPAGKAASVAEEIVAAGAKPCGLGARDTLRLEKGFLLSGQDFHLDRSPLEAGQDRFVEMDHEFVGRVALEKQRTDGLALRLVGLLVEEPNAIPRHGTPVVHDGKVIAQVTSGGLSPSLDKGIALAYLPPALAAPGTEVGLDLRGRTVPARVHALPFYPPSPARR
ncbi:MAG: glycine cleavage system aminomethyltransferase GcvT [Thermoplasmata archaeon]|nr:glycine cleavage system aminomethyltransferase GcvT [Thermoplasmata archaeon]